LIWKRKAKTFFSHGSNTEETRIKTEIHNRAKSQTDERHGCDTGNRSVSHPCLSSVLVFEMSFVFIRVSSVLDPWLKNVFAFQNGVLGKLENPAVAIW